MSIARRRAKYDIYADILRSAGFSEHSTLAKISYGSNLPINRVKVYLRLLISHGFVRERQDGDSKRYRITERGVDFIETHKKMSKFLAALEEPVEIDIPKLPPISLPNRIETGYKKLDDILCGGIPESFSVILTSPSCQEKETIATRFLSLGVKEHEATFFLTTDVAKANMLAQKLKSGLHLFICNPQAGDIPENLPDLVKLAGTANLTNISIALSSALRTLNRSPSNRRRICIDIISDILLEHHAVDTRKWLSRTIPEVKTEGFTILAMINPYMHPPEEVQAIIGLFEGEIDLYERGSGEDARKFLRIRKLLGQKYLDGSFPTEKDEADE